MFAWCVEVLCIPLCQLFVPSVLSRRRHVTDRLLFATYYASLLRTILLPTTRYDFLHASFLVAGMLEVLGLVGYGVGVGTKSKRQRRAGVGSGRVWLRVDTGKGGGQSFIPQGRWCMVFSKERLTRSTTDAHLGPSAKPRKVYLHTYLLRAVTVRMAARRALVVQIDMGTLPRPLPMT